MYLEVRNRYLSRFIRRMLGINTIIIISQHFESLFGAYSRY